MSGYLVQMPFKEGRNVKKVDLLFEVDPRPYKAQLDQAEGQVNLYKAQLAGQGELRPRPGRCQDAGASRQQLDQDKAAIDEADAAVKAFQASMEVYKLNLSFTKVTSPISGQVSRYFLTLGNLVVQDQTLLTTVVSLDPMYVYFDMDEGTLLRARRAINEGKIVRYESGSYPSSWDCRAKPVFPTKVSVNFVNNQVNPNTAASVAASSPIRSRPRAFGCCRPGCSCGCGCRSGNLIRRCSVIDRAIGSDQGLKYVYVVDAKNTLQQRSVTHRALQGDGLRVITRAAAR